MIESLKIGNRAILMSQNALTKVDDAIRQNAPSSSTSSMAHSNLFMPAIRSMESISKLFIQFQESLSPQVKEENRDKYK
jgi:hypothetical protein